MNRRVAIATTALAVFLIAGCHSSTQKSCPHDTAGKDGTCYVTVPPVTTQTNTTVTTSTSVAPSTSTSTGTVTNTTVAPSTSPTP